MLVLTRDLACSIVSSMRALVEVCVNGENCMRTLVMCSREAILGFGIILPIGIGRMGEAILFIKTHKIQYILTIGY